MGAPHEVPVQLVYSKKEFKMPPNIYIIGTMNTADRSIEALDTALRRRFSFEELSPDPSLLNTMDIDGTKIDLAKMLIAINQRIEKILDKDHCIGHSYFLKIEESGKPLDSLRYVFGNKILPLLKEYFYGDLGKIGLILGDKFIEEEEHALDLAEFGYPDIDLIEDKKVYRFKDINSLNPIDFINIYEKPD